jgi:AraC-like DNA-binding protein
MVYLQKPASPYLRPWVRSLWYYRVARSPHHRERVLPNGCMQIILNLSRGYLTECGEDGRENRRLPGAIITGARARYVFVDTSDMEEIVGIFLRPGGFAGLFHERADLFFERSVGLEDVCGASSLTERLREAPTPVEKLRLLEAFVTRRLHPATRRSELVDHAMHLFRRTDLRVAECARSIGISERRLSQVFQEQVGMSPKMWHRTRRFQTTVRALYNGVDVPWAELALRCGYYDQSHFANDFHAFSGINPTTYSRHRGSWQNHVPIL